MPEYDLSKLQFTEFTTEPKQVFAWVCPRCEQKGEEADEARRKWAARQHVIEFHTVPQEHIGTDGLIDSHYKNVYHVETEEEYTLLAKVRGWGAIEPSEEQKKEYFHWDGRGRYVEVSLRRPDLHDECYIEGYVSLPMYVTMVTRDMMKFVAEAQSAVMKPRGFEE